MSKKSISKYLRFLKNSSLNTYKNYMVAIRQYELCHDMTIESLVMEALVEQDKQVPLHKLSIIDRLEKFQEYLINQELVLGTIQNYITKIKSVYHKNRVTIPYIEPINPHICKKREVIEYTDILTKDELREALPLMKLPIRARIMAMIQGGLSNEECEHLTTRAFIDELYKYHQKDNDLDALKWLSNENNPIIWVTKILRVKTGKPYYFLIGPEAVNMIASAKLYESNLKRNHGNVPEKLFDTHKISVNRVCSEINKKLGLGKAGDTNRLRPHMCRKFHATYISGSVLSYEENSLTLSQIDELQGRGKTKVQDTYIKTNPLKQKLLYAKVINNVSLWHEYTYQIIDEDIKVYLVDTYKENKILKKELKNLSNQLSQKQIASEKVQKLREELGDDGLKQLIGEILNAN